MNQQEDSRYSAIDKYIIVILLSGKAGVGKTTIANFMELYLRENLGYNGVFKVSFADNVKRTAIKCFGWDGRKDSKGRKLLQNIGNTGREYNDYLWVADALMGVYADSVVPPNFIIVDDWRFPNEAEYFEIVRDIYKVIKIRVYAPERETLVDSPEYYDISETSLPEIGWTGQDKELDLVGYYDWFISNRNNNLDELDKRIVRPLIDNILDKLEEEA